jgi:type IV pilus assembly protein PilN
MIRINLLPQKRRVERQQEGSQLWLAVLLALLLAEVAGFFVWHGQLAEELGQQVRKNRELKAQIDQSKREVADQANVKKKLDELRAREDAIEKLQKGRTGPSAVLLELARVMTPGRGPSVSPERLNQVRRENPLSVYNANWDPRRLWISEYIEKNRSVRLDGHARNGEDVSELARRMNLSDFFTDVKLLPGEKTKDKETGLQLVKFQLEAKVQY